MQKIKVLIVDDDQRLLEHLENLLGEKVDVALAASYEEALQVSVSFRPDVAVCDIFIGGADCVAGIRSLKFKLRGCRVLIMTGNPDIDPLIELINLNVDGLLEKPFLAEELLDKIHTMIQPRIARDLELNLERRFVLSQGQQIQLTKTECLILNHLLEAEGQMKTRDELVSLVWPNVQVAKNALDTHLYNLKRKVPALDSKLVCVYGDGYVLHAV